MCRVTSRGLGDDGVGPDPQSIDELRTRLAFAEAVAHATPDCLYIYDIVDHEYRYQNVSIPEFLGYTPEQVAEITAEQDFHAYVGHPDEVADQRESLLAQRVMDEDESLQSFFRLRSGTSEYRWYSLRTVSFSRTPDGRVREVLGLMRDVHDVVQATSRLNASERRFRELFARSPAGTALVYDDGHFGEVNDALCAFVGMSREELAASTYDAIVHPDDRRAAREARARFSASVEITHRSERRFVHRDGSVRWGRLSVTRIEEGVNGLSLVTFEDVTSIKEVEDRLRHAAMHDMLTGLPNRRMLTDRLDHALKRRAREGSSVAVLFVDLDGVKKVNDELGHETGDALLVAVAKRMTDTLRATDTVARVGGDEFVVVCPDLESPDELPTLADRLLAAARVELFAASGGKQPLSASASIGVALAQPGLETVTDLIRAADNAMYAAKRSGRDRWELANKSHATAIFVRPAPMTSNGAPATQPLL